MTEPAPTPSDPSPADAPAPPAAPAEPPAQEKGETDPAELLRSRGKSPELAAVLAWLVPGLGHLYAGFWTKGLVSLVLLLGLWVAGMWLSRGEAISLHPEEGHPYAFVAQVGVGLPTGLGVLHSKGQLPGFEPRESARYQDEAWVARLPDQDTGLLFTMVAGLLNLLLVYDALQGVPGAIARRAEEARTRRRIEQLRAELEKEAAAAGGPGGGAA